LAFPNFQTASGKSIFELKFSNLLQELQKNEQKSWDKE